MRDIKQILFGISALLFLSATFKTHIYIYIYHIHIYIYKTIKVKGGLRSAVKKTCSASEIMF